MPFLGELTILERKNSMRKILWIILCVAVAPLYGGDADTTLFQSPAVLGPSARNLLGRGVEVAGLGKASPTTLNILALRVSFLRDSVATTTGDGGFDLSTSSAQRFNPPPHNRSYFEHQLRALAHYYSSVSRGLLTLTYQVYPFDEESSYVVPHNMQYYSAEGDEALKSQRWAELLADAVAVAENQDSIDFSAYDSYFIFHAGVGADYVFDFDPTPYDIQSVFLDFESLRSTLGAGETNYQGIPVNQGAFFIQDGLILPETETQEDYEIGMLGTMTLLFGAQLGLPSLSDAENGRPGIGRWGLMDQGSANLQGLVPAQPCAWSKVFLGWEEPVLMRDVANPVQIAAALAAHPHKVLKIPITTKEYFLVENRQRDVNGDERIIGYDSENNRIEILEDGRLLPLDWSGTIVRLDEYDFGMPGSGLLIWHINETVIESNFATNTINTDIDSRGIALVECDAAQDIGHYYGWPLFGYDAGDYWDPWWRGNESHKVANESDEVAFTPTSLPSSDDNNGAKTHIYLTEFSDLDSVMTVTVRTDLAQAGFPQYTDATFTRNAVSVAPRSTVSQGAGKVIVAASDARRLFAWKEDGSSLLEVADSTAMVDINGDTTYHPLAIFAELADSIITAPLVADLNGDDRAEVTVASVNDSIYVWELKDDDADGRGDLLCSSGTPSSVSTELVAVAMPPTLYCGCENGELISCSLDGAVLSVNWRANISDNALVGLSLLQSDLLVTTRDGEILLLDSDGSLKWTVETGVRGEFTQPVVADVDGDGSLDAVVVLANGTVHSYSAGGAELFAPHAHSFGAVVTRPAVGDVNGDGFPEIIFADSRGLRAFNGAGVVAENLSIPFESEFTLGSAPLAGDFDGDEAHDILLYIPGQSLKVFAHKSQYGETAFPVGAEVLATPALSDLDGDGDVEVIALSADGVLNVWNSAAHYSDSAFPWAQHRGNALHTAAYTSASQPQQKTGVIFADNSVYCYPNPTTDNVVYFRYQLVTPVSGVTVTVYDMVGERVAELTGTNLVNSDNEIPWDLRGISTGVYFARVAAENWGTSQAEIIKVAVVK